jgi:hypothetical protein
MNSANPIQADIKSRWLFPLWPFAFSLLFFLLFFLLGFPWPGIDDLFFTGASLNLAQGGDYSNPLLARQDFPSHFYFIHPPAYSYALAGWLKLFGIHTVSLLGFQLLVYLLLCVATILVLRKYQAAVLWEWLVPLGVAAAFMHEGLRPEAFSVALTMSGYALLLSCQPGGFPLFCGFFLMILGASVAERITFFSGALMLSAIFDLPGRGVRRGTLALPAGLALLVVCLGLMALIDFKLNEFWHDFRYCAGVKTWGMVDTVKFFFHDIAGIRWPVVFVGLIFVLFIPWLRSKTVARTVLLLVGAFVAMILIGGLGHGAIWYVILILLLTGAVGIRPVSSRWTILIQLLVASVLLVANSRNFICAAGVLGGKIKADQGDQLAARQIKAAPGHPVLIDGATARYVFDYQLAPDFFDFYFSSPFPKTLPTDEPLRPGDTYLIGPDSVNWLNEKTRLNRPIPVWKPFGNKKSFFEYPRWVYVIHPDDLPDLPGKS